MENTEEIWKDIDGYIGYYQVSNLGKVRSLDRIIKYKNNKVQLLKGRILKHSFDSQYPTVGLHLNNVVGTRQIHRLVAIAFLENPLNKPQVNHINGVKNDNRLENLEWVTHQENNIHARETGLIKQRGENSHKAKLKEKDVFKIREMAANGMKLYKIAAEFGIHKVTVGCIVNRKKWKHI
jgi:hypothetical protein